MTQETKPTAAIDDTIQSPPTKEVSEAPYAPVAPITPVTPPSSPPPANRSRGFAAFAGAGSPFAASSFVANGVASPSPQRPIWCGNGSVLGDQSSALSCASHDGIAPADASRSVAGSPPVENGTEEGAALAAMETKVKTTVAREFY